MAKKRKPENTAHKKGAKRPTKRMRQALFLQAFSMTGIILDGCQAAGISRDTVERWRQEPKFKALYDKAETDACDRLEREAYRRANTGTQKPVFYQGVECGRVQEYSDTLLIFLMKGRNRAKWGENAEVNVNLNRAKIVINKGDFDNTVSEPDESIQ